MAIVHLLAHFDDEYAALPLIEARRDQDQWFLYVADYATPALAAARLAETRVLLAGLGLDPGRAVFLESGVPDGGLHRDPARVMAAISRGVAALPTVDRLVCAAWEGGHQDHDVCAAAAVRLARDLPGRPPIDQFPLYHGRGLSGPLFRACDPIPENGPVTRVPRRPAAWIDYALAVRAFPSQWKAWIGLWPSMFATFAVRGFGWQALDPERVRERPHAGPLLYERRSGVTYAEVRRAADAVLNA